MYLSQLLLTPPILFSITGKPAPVARIFQALFQLMQGMGGIYRNLEGRKKEEARILTTFFLGQYFWKE
jgi:hypothetical protein